LSRVEQEPQAKFYLARGPFNQTGILRQYTDVYNWREYSDMFCLVLYNCPFYRGLDGSALFSTTAPFSSCHRGVSLIKHRRLSRQSLSILALLDGGSALQAFSTGLFPNAPLIVRSA
jgi:hypothetical protein